METLNPRKTPQPLRKISITPPDKIFSPPIRMKSLTLTSSRKKHSPPPDKITLHEKIVNFTKKNFSPLKKSQSPRHP